MLARALSTRLSRHALARCSSSRILPHRGSLISPASLLPSDNGRGSADGPLRSLPHWEQAAASLARVNSAERWEKGRDERLAEFGRSKQWKTLSLQEATALYAVRRRDLENVPFVAKYNVYSVARETRFYIVFDVQARGKCPMRPVPPSDTNEWGAPQDAALRRWGSAAAIRQTLAERQVCL